MSSSSDLPRGSTRNTRATALPAQAGKKGRKASSGPQSEKTPDSSGLLEQATSLWLQGNWSKLIQLGKDAACPAAADPELALLVASAHMQAGDMTAATDLLKCAIQAGCDKKNAARILISGAYNSIGRASAAAGPMDKGLRHFIHAVAVGMPGADAESWAQIRNIKQLGQLGLFSDSDQEAQKTSAFALLEKIDSGMTMAPAQSSSGIDSAALSFYQNLGGLGKSDSPPFVLIDSKSMPRSGLHYLKTSLTQLLGEHFSFCEWYQEAGCCMRRPCALTGFASHAQQSGSCRIRLIKSHDFEHEDPYFETSPHLQRLVLIRDPLYVLTSWFELEQLGRYAKVLSHHAIGMNKIWLAHEKEVLKAAYNILDDCFEPPSADHLASWLVDKSAYIISFLCRWALPAIDAPAPYTHLVKYEEIDRFVLRWMEPYMHSLSKAARMAIEEHAAHQGSTFKKRKGPYSANSTVVASYLLRHSSLFEEASARIKALFPQHVPALFDT